MTLASQQDAPNIDRMIGDVVSTLMGTRRMKAAHLARDIGMSETALSERMNGNRSWRSKDLRKVADYFGVGVGLLFLTPEEVQNRLSLGGYKLTSLPMNSEQLELGLLLDPELAVA